MTRPSVSSAARATLLATVAVAIPLPSYGSPGLDWKPFPTDEVRVLIENRSLSDDEIVRRLVGYLDERMTMSTHPSAEKHRPNFGFAAATLLRHMSKRLYPAEPKERPESIRKAIDDLPRRADIKNKERVRSLLFLALAAAGNLVEGEVLAILEDSSTPQEVLDLALEGLEGTRVPIRAIPSLIGLLDHPWSVLVSTTIGPSRTHRSHPIRERVLKCLQKLEIDVQEAHRLDETPDQWGDRYETLELRLDRSVLQKRLDFWIRQGGQAKRDAEAVTRVLGTGTMPHPR